MSGGLKKYEAPDFTARAAPRAPEARPYEEPRFSSHVNPQQADAVHRRRADAFHLDRIVVEQLGIEQREQQEAEARIRKEIERRWEGAFEKAEVAGYTKGLEEGKAEAFKAELPRIRERIERLDALLGEFDKGRERIFAANEGFLMDLVAQVAGMVVLKEVELDRDYVRRLVTTLLHQVATREDIKIHLAEADYANAAELSAALEKEFGRLSNTTIEASPEIPVGGCKIETRFGVVDASLEAQIENVKRALKG